MLTHRGIHHIALICSDYERSKRFYTQALGFRILAETRREARNSWKLDLEGPVGEGGGGVGGLRLELFSFPAPPPRPSHPEACGLRHLAFSVPDLDKAIAQLAAAGVPCEPVRTDDLTGKRFTFFADPDGLPLELYEA